MGAVMLVMGGFNTETRVVMDDFCTFDFRESTWVPCDTHKADGSRFTAQALYENNRSKEKHADLPGPRRFHRMCAIWDQQFYETAYKGKETKKDRYMWI